MLTCQQNLYFIKDWSFLCGWITNSGDTPKQIKPDLKSHTHERYHSWPKFRRSSAGHSAGCSTGSGHDFVTMLQRKQVVRYYTGLRICYQNVTQAGLLWSVQHICTLIPKEEFFFMKLYCIQLSIFTLFRVQWERNGVMPLVLTVKNCNMIVCFHSSVGSCRLHKAVNTFSPASI
jgi:hypothetical protein